MLVIYYGETPLVNCRPRSILLHLIIQSTSSTVLLYSLQTYIIFHTIRLIHCFQQAGEIDNITVKLGQSILVVLYAGSRQQLYFLAPLLGRSTSLPQLRTRHFSSTVDTFIRVIISYWFD